MRPNELQGMTLLSAANVFLQFPAELADDVLDRPAGAVGEAANRGAGHDAHLVADLVQDLQVFQSALAAPHPVGDLEHPAGALPARRTLPSRLMGEEATDVVQH